MDNTIYIPIEIANFFGLDGDEEPGPDGLTVVRVKKWRYREALILARLIVTANNLNDDDIGHIREWLSDESDL
jgi:hypothetical protein